MEGGEAGGTLVCHLLQDLKVPGSNLDSNEKKVLDGDAARVASHFYMPILINPYYSNNLNTGQPNT